MTPFFITGLPRSRTAWLANLLTWGDSFCFHEATAACGSMRELKEMLTLVPIGTRHVGNADPNIGLVPELILEAFPKAKIVFIHRSLEQCVESEWTAVTWEGLQQYEEVSKESLRSLMVEASTGIARLARALPPGHSKIVRYQDLESEDFVREIWNFCIPNTPFPRHRYQQLQDLRVTQIFRKRLGRHPTQPFRLLLEEQRNLKRENLLENRTAHAA